MKGTINISGDIGNFYSPSGMEIAGVSLADVIAQVKNQKDATSFDVIINSEGGSVKTGMDIYNYLQSLPQQITTIGRGVVASIATVVFMAGSVRKVEKNVIFMIHLPSGGVDGTAEQITDYSKRLKKVEDELVGFYSNKLDLEKEAVKALLHDETYMSEEQLTSLGIITEQPESIVAKLFLDKNRKSKKQKVMATNKKSLLDQIKNLINGNEGEIVSKMMYDANNKEVVFPDLEEDATPTAGDMATIDGEPANGEVVMADGMVYVFEDGILTEMKEGSEEEEDAEEMAQLKQQLQDALDAKSTQEAELEVMKAKLNKAKSDLKAKETILAKIAKMKVEDFEEEDGFESKRKKPFKKQTRNTKSRAGSAIARIRNKA